MDKCELFRIVSKINKTRLGVKPKVWSIWNSARLFQNVLFNMGNLHLVLPALNLSSLNAGISIMMQQVRLMMFSLNMGWVAHKILVLSPRPLSFWFLVLGFGVCGQGLTIRRKYFCFSLPPYYEI